MKLHIEKYLNFLEKDLGKERVALILGNKRHDENYIELLLKANGHDHLFYESIL